MSEGYTGFKVYDVDDVIIEDLYNNGQIPNWDRRHVLYPNMYIELKSTINPKHTALARVNYSGEWVEKIETPEANGLKPRNREQVFALDALIRDDIPVVVLTGSAGTGKTILTLAMAIEKVQQKKYSKVIITRPMSQVGRYQLGTLPGDVKEKFYPYLVNYATNLEQFVGNRNVEYLLEQSRFEMVPLQLIRGASFNNCLVIADEMQVCNGQETLTIGTRIGEDSKLIIMGDLNQRDEKIAKDKTGLHKLMNDKRVKESPLVAAVELQRCERSKTARLFAEVFEE